MCQNCELLFVNIRRSLPGKIKYQIHNTHNRTYSENIGCTFETYNNDLMSHGCNLYEWYHTWSWQRCVSFLLINMRCLTGHLCCVVITNFQVLSYSMKNLTGITSACTKQYVFMCTELYHSVLCMKDHHIKKMLIVWHSAKNSYKWKLTLSKIACVMEIFMT